MEEWRLYNRNTKLQIVKKANDLYSLAVGLDDRCLSLPTEPFCSVLLYGTHVALSVMGNIRERCTKTVFEMLCY